MRKCIGCVHRHLQPTLDFLAQTIDWDDLNSFVSSRPKKGKAKGHGLYFLIHYLCASHCEGISASAPKSPSLFSFPPSGEIEIDVQGRIETGANTITVKIGKIKISNENISDVKKQLKPSLVFFAGLHELIVEKYDVVPICYDLMGYIFSLEETNFIKNEVLPLPQLGEISYIMYKF